MIRLLSHARRVALLTVMLATIATDATAQHDNRGRNFWITFMANYGSGGEFEPSDLRLYLSAEAPAIARIINHATGDTAVMNLPTARTTYEFDVSAEFTALVELDTAVEIEHKAIQVIADQDITCYGVNIRSRSADAFVSFPDDVLTRSYIVLAYPNGYSNPQFGNRYDTPSQFAVVATEDGTVVNVNPSTPLMTGRPKAPFTVTLDQGEVFNGQAKLGAPNDVSGTEITTNKPVAVFAGNQRTSVPLSVGNFRDHLVEQMPPLAVWGKEAICTPHFPIVQSPHNAVVRVLAAFDDTAWQIDGVDQPPLSRAVPVEVPLNDPIFIKADKPILVAQYEHSVDDYRPGTNEPLPGDPFMMIVTPTEQFHNTYIFQSVAHQEFSNFGHFINLVIATPATGTVRLDGLPVNDSWKPTTKPGYSYAQFRISPGSHIVEADSVFGVYSYGYGPANSYGYSGGTLFRALVHDFEAPDLEQGVSCGAVSGFAFDGRLTDDGIDSLYAHRNARNVDLTVEPFARGADTVRYSAKLIDPYQDGVVSVKAIDIAGRSETVTNVIAGFTVRAAGAVGSTPVVLDTMHLFNRGGGCVTLTLQNHGIFPQLIRAVDLVPDLSTVTFDLPLPITLRPGERVPLTVCATAWPDTLVSARLVLTGECDARAIAELPIESGTDTIPPVISATGATCNREVLLTITDIVGKYSRIESVELESLENARLVSTTPQTSALPATAVELRLAPIDEYHDLIYQVRVTDVAGNVGIYRDTIGGFTVAALDASRDSVSIRFDRDLRIVQIQPGLERCDSVTLVNYGARTLRLSTLRFGGNRGYSIPPSQLPFEIAPGSERRLAVCVEALTSDAVVDTLFMEDACGRSDALVIKAPVAILTTSDRCNNAIEIASLGAAKRTFIATPHPNPSSGATATVDVGLASDGDIAIELLDASGTVASTVMRGVAMSAGVHRIGFDISTLGNGTYFCRLRTAGGVQLVEKLIIRR